MKRSIKEEIQPLYAMTTINPKLNQQLGIRIELEQRYEAMIPHLQVYIDGDRNPKRCAYIRLDKAEYFSLYKDGLTLNKKQKKQFIQVMTTIWGKERLDLYKLDDAGDPTSELYMVPATGYEAAVNIWCDTYYDTEQFFNFDVEGRPIMPDYNNL